MAFQALLEVALHVESFRNIDLFHQGLYCLRCTLLMKDKLACPYNLASTPTTKRKTSSRTEPHYIYPARLDDIERSYVSRTFLVRYCEEEVEINEMCYFRLELPSNSSDPLALKVELLFSDMGGNVNLEAFDPESNPAFRTVTTANFVLNEAEKGLHEYFPVVFDDSYYCTVQVMLHSALLDFRFRPSVEQKSPTLDIASSLAKVLFLDRHNKPKSFIGAEETDKVHATYMQRLVLAFEKVRSFYITVASKCIKPKERPDLRFIPPPLTLPGSPVQLPYTSSRKQFLDVLNYSQTEEVREEVPEFSMSSISPGVDDERPSVQVRFSERIMTHDPKRIASTVLCEINMLAGQVLQIWHRLLDALKVYPRRVEMVLMQRYSSRVRDRWNECVVSTETITQDYTLHTQPTTHSDRANAAVARRRQLERTQTVLLPVTDVNLFPAVEAMPILFEDLYLRSIRQETSSYQGVHLFILVHGFQGNSFDMRLLKNNLSLLYPEALFLCSNANEETTEGDINEMGVRLAQEVVNYITEWCPENALGRISFIGHSMGGLIIRAALPYLEQFAPKMHMFMTLSSPHLGYMYNTSRLIDAGMWVLKKVRRYRCLQQLSMSDHTDPRQTLIYELSMKKGLNWFRHIVLVGSYQDQYAPFDSARMEVPDRPTQDERSRVYHEVASNLLSSVTASALHRLDVDFKISEKSLDSLIGRAAHIMFLENQALMRLLINRYPEFFS
jgi:pimeloyl-ACP methyl ester carboxylesterase